MRLCLIMRVDEWIQWNLAKGTPQMCEPSFEADLMDDGCMGAHELDTSWFVQMQGYSQRDIIQVYIAWTHILCLQKG